GVAQIDSDGLLKAKKDGTVLVRATAKDGTRIYGQVQIVITNQLQPTIWANAYSIETETVNPAIEINLINDVFTSAAYLRQFWDIDTGDTTLTLNTITVNTSMKVTLQFKGTTKPGTITIQPQTDILSSGDATNAIEITAPVVSVTDIILSDDDITLIKGETYQLTASISPENATNKNMVWSSEDASVATVAGGLVTAVSEGDIYIIVSSEDGAKEASCKVTVVEKPYMIALTAVLDDVSDTEVAASGDPLSLALTTGSVTKKIVIDMNEEVQLGDDPTVYFNGTDTEYGTIALDATDPSKIIVTPSGTNGQAAAAGIFTFQVKAGAVKDLLGNENEAVSFKLVVSN
ncbi:MAG: Ig domain-containing protein, partial [Eubacteriaceae bacterium]